MGVRFPPRALRTERIEVLSASTSMNWYVYIVKCNDSSLYTGITSNLERRIWQHNNSKRGAKSVKPKLPVKLIYKELYNNRSEALKRESEIKGWKREKKLELVRDGLGLNEVKTWS